MVGDWILWAFPIVRCRGWDEYNPLAGKQFRDPQTIGLAADRLVKRTTTDIHRICHPKKSGSLKIEEEGLEEGSFMAVEGDRWLAEALKYGLYVMHLLQPTICYSSTLD